MRTAKTAAQLILGTAGRFYPFSILVRKLIVAVRFRDEVRLLEGKHRSRSEHQSILFFTLHKTASVYTGNILHRLTQDAGLTAIDFVKYYSTIDRLGNFYEFEGLGGVFEPTGYFYGPIRRYVPVPSMELYKAVLMVRDPRDVLTSLYYSNAYSHFVAYHNPKTARSRLEARRRALEQTIDEFVLVQSPSYLSRYIAYCRHLLNASNVLLVKYEHMIEDFSAWLLGILEFLDLTPDEGLLNEIVDQADFKVGEEDIQSHKRQAAPGDHLRKLRSETIDLLNERFQLVLDQLGYRY